MECYTLQARAVSLHYFLTQYLLYLFVQLVQILHERKLKRQQESLIASKEEELKRQIELVEESFKPALVAQESCEQNIVCTSSINQSGGSPTPATTAESLRELSSTLESYLDVIREKDLGGSNGTAVKLGQGKAERWAQWLHQRQEQGSGAIPAVIERIIRLSDKYVDKKRAAATSAVDTALSSLQRHKERDSAVLLKRAAARPAPPTVDGSDRGGKSPAPVGGSISLTPSREKVRAVMVC